MNIHKIKSFGGDWNEKTLPKMLAFLFVVAMNFGFSTVVFAQDYLVQFSDDTYNGTSVIRYGPSTAVSKVGTKPANTIDIHMDNV